MLKEEKRKEKKIAQIKLTTEEGNEALHTKILNKSDLDYLKKKTRFNKNEIIITVEQISSLN